MSGQSFLWASAAPLNIEKLFAIDKAPLFDGGDGQQLGAQGAQDQVAAARVLGYRLKGVGVLTHGPLTEHLTGKQKVEVSLTHHFTGDAEHHGMAVDAGVEITTVAVAGIFQHLQMNIADVLDDQWNTDLASGNSGSLGAEKGRDIDNAGDIDSLPLEGHSGQYAVETAGKES